jgi:hypothetical protein
MVVDRHRDLDATSNDLQRLTVSDSGQHENLAAIQAKVAEFTKDTVNALRACDQDLSSLAQRLARVEAKLAILMWGCGVVITAFVGLLVKEAHL